MPSKISHSNYDLQVEFLTHDETKTDLADISAAHKSEDWNMAKFREQAVFESIQLKESASGHTFLTDHEGIEIPFMAWGHIVRIQGPPPNGSDRLQEPESVSQEITIAALKSSNARAVQEGLQSAYRFILANRKSGNYLAPFKIPTNLQSLTARAPLITKKDENYLERDPSMIPSELECKAHVAALVLSDQCVFTSDNIVRTMILNEANGAKIWKTIPMHKLRCGHLAEIRFHIRCEPVHKKKQLASCQMYLHLDTVKVHETRGVRLYNDLISKKRKASAPCDPVPKRRKIDNEKTNDVAMAAPVNGQPDGAPNA